MNDDHNVVPIRDSIAIPPRPSWAMDVRWMPTADAVHLRRAADLLRDEAGQMRDGVAAMALVAQAMGLDALADGMRSAMTEAFDEFAACWGRR